MKYTKRASATMPTGMAKIYRPISERTIPTTMSASTSPIISAR